MRLIDADELRKTVKENLDDLDVASILAIIDNAPTVEQKYYERVIAQINPIIEARPQGEWIITQDEKFYHYKCPFCGFWATGDFLRTNGNLDLPNFCEKCGADMRGGAE